MKAECTRNADGSCIVASWYGLKSEQAGESICFGEYGDRSIQACGTFSGAAVIFEGSNDGTHFCPLKDPFGDNISITAEALCGVTEATLHARPRVSGGDANTLLDVHVLIRRPFPAQRVIQDTRMTRI